MNASDEKQKIRKAGSAARVILAFYKSCVAESQLEMGINVEKEHEDVYDYFSKYLKKHGVKMPLSREKFFEMIAKAHIKELPDYYTRLKKMEGSKHKEALDFSSIAPLLTPERKINDRELSRVLRFSIAAELDAIHLYELIADATDDEDIKKVMTHVAEEEKVHVGEFQEMLKRVDKTTQDLLEEGTKEVEDEVGSE